MEKMEIRFENGMYKVTGRIDYSTAEWFKMGLADAFGKESVTLDFKGVEYISSAGLRVLMALRHSGCNVKVVNVSREVCDVFEMTGFDSFITVQRLVKEISVEGLQCIGTGATGAAYRLDDEKIVKLFYDRVSEPRVAAELATAREAFILGVPTCIPFGLVQSGSRYGIIYELIHSSTLSELFAHADEAEEDRLVKQYVELLKNASTIDCGEKPKGMDITGAMIGAAPMVKNVFFNDEEFAEALKLFRAMRENRHFVHGDAHPGNVMMQDGELIFIDMTTSGYGDPFWDVVAIANVCYVNTIVYPDEAFRANYLMTHERALDVFHKFFAAYYAGESVEQIERLKKLAIGTAAFRMLMGQVYNQNRDPAVIDRLKALTLETAALLDEADTAEAAA